MATFVAIEHKKFLALAGSLIAIFLAALDQTIATTAIAKITLDLKDSDKISWIFTGYMLFSTIFIPIYGKLSDIYGRQRFYLVAILLFIFSSYGAGATETMNGLVFWRCVQGVAGGALLVNSLALICDLFEPLERAKWQGFISLVYAISSLAGPLIGGFIADTYSWRWNFYMNVPLGFLSIAIILYSVKAVKFNPQAGKKVDYRGAFLLAGALLPLLLVFEAVRFSGGFLNAQVFALCLSFCIILLLFVVSQQRVKQPIISFVILKERASLLPILIAFIFAFCKFSLIVYMPFFVYDVFKISSVRSGLIMSPMAIAMLAASVGGGYALARTGKYRSLCFSSILLYCSAFWLLSFENIFSHPAGLIISMILAGLGNGMSMPLMNILVTSANAKEKVGEATAALQLARNVGGTAGIAVFGCILNAYRAQGMLEASNQVYTAAFFIALCAVPLVWLIPQGSLLDSAAPGTASAVQRAPLFEATTFLKKPSDASSLN